jgi:hypothetical protein
MLAMYCTYVSIKIKGEFCVLLRCFHMFESVNLHIIVYTNVWNVRRCKFMYMVDCG